MPDVVGRKSPHSLYSEAHVTFEDDAGAYDQHDAEGFIKLNALRLKLLAQSVIGDSTVKGANRVAYGSDSRLRDRPNPIGA